MGLDGLAPDVLEVTVHHVVLVTPVADGCVPAARAMRMDLALMTLVVAHFVFLLI